MSPAGKLWDCPRCGKSVKVWCQDCFKSQGSFRYWAAPGRREYNLASAKKSNKSDRRVHYISKWQKENKDKVNAATKRWRQKYPEKVTEKNRRNYWENGGKDKTKDWRLRRDYGISLEDFRAMYAAQEGACAICADEYHEEAMVVDHCHESGVVRGLLCINCNMGLGQFRDNTESLTAAVDYLIQAKAMLDKLQQKGTP